MAPDGLPERPARRRRDPLRWLQAFLAELSNKAEARLGTLLIGRRLLCYGQRTEEARSKAVVARVDSLLVLEISFGIANIISRAGSRPPIVQLKFAPIAT